MSQPTFNQQLKKYAQLIVKTGINVQAGDTVVLQIAVTQTQLAHHIVQQAYTLGAAEVLVVWADSFVQKQLLTQADKTRLTAQPDYRKAEIDYWLSHQAKRISVMSTAPNALADVDPERIHLFQTAAGQLQQTLRRATQNNDVSWTVVAAAEPDWAQIVFPDLTPTAAEAALWQEIFKTTRVDQPDPVQAWAAHDAQLRQKATWLNDLQFDALHYQAPGTDLTVGLPKAHFWSAASSQNAHGQRFMANMPTEEVFTAPDHRRIDGTVTATKPLSYAGQMLDGLEFTFKAGQVVQATAKTGQTLLTQLLSTDDGAKSLGEVALVPVTSPIAQADLVFHNTLFDENASNHLALGSAYPFSIKAGTKMNPLALQKAGLNQSLIHVDFMVGSEQMAIDGLTKTGQVVPIFRNGTWV
ncbi:aminopeptidase [Agrilactobacillus yilanensis]|uniref:Aminopeptidase n=1 Tax=Agrilactobacillus yilanensis TaxID=2485997 RepID=A0ABW4JC02_9LACO|nr:aminopeptidase [Agrilactobacillus yilanensis]